MPNVYSIWYSITVVLLLHKLLFGIVLDFILWNIYHCVSILDCVYFQLSLLFVNPRKCIEDARIRLRKTSYLSNASCPSFSEAKRICKPSENPQASVEQFQTVSKSLRSRSSKHWSDWCLIMPLTDMPAGCASLVFNVWICTSLGNTQVRISR